MAAEVGCLTAKAANGKMSIKFKESQIESARKLSLSKKRVDRTMRKQVVLEMIRRFRVNEFKLFAIDGVAAQKSR